MMCFGMKDRKRSKTNHCVIVLLDDTQLVHELHASSTGQDLLDVVIKHLNLLETSYFGLKYLEHQEGIPSKQVDQLWLDMEKSALKQLRNVQPMTVYFGVKYYAADPCKLAEEITRYQFFLQCKQDILHSRLPISFELAIELFALAVQSELGDYDPQRQQHDDNYVSEFQFLPNQSLELEKRVAFFHRTLAGQVPATAELNFLERVKWLDLYGCELHPIEYEDDIREEYALGLNPSGVLVLRNKLKVAQYVWPRIVKTKFHGRCFLMDVTESNERQQQGGSSSSSSSRFGFRLPDKAASRRLCQAIEEHKSFYHLIHNSASLHQLAQRQHQQLQYQQMKLSQRFRNSIRSAINVASSGQHLNIAGHKLRSSVKSVANQQLQMMQQYESARRAPPAVVRTPSRRYGSDKNRSLKLGYNEGSVMMPLTSTAGPHTMSESQRQQAIMLMSGKSHTLKPVSSSAKLDSKETKRNPYYEMMMMMMMAQQYQAGQAAAHPATLAVGTMPSSRNLAPQQGGISRATSMLNEPAHSLLNSGMQFYAGKSSASQLQQQQQHYGTSSRRVGGRESPRSTKSALASSFSNSTVRLANKKIAKQQQQHLLCQQQQTSMNNNIPRDYYGIYRSENTSNSANASPKSARSTSILISKHKSKSTNDNLNLLHINQQTANNKQIYDNQYIPSALKNNNKMLLATAAQLQMQHPPPPGYSSKSHSGYGSSEVNQRVICVDKNEKENDTSKVTAHQSVFGKKRATIAPIITAAISSNRYREASRSSDAAHKRNIKGKQQSDGEDYEDYHCSRSDCSSLDDPGNTNNSSMNTNSKLVNRRRRSTQTAVSNKDYQDRQILDSEQREWNAIRKRHNEFLLHGSFIGNQLEHPTSGQVDKNCCQSDESDNPRYGDYNNNSNISQQQQLIKNISNKQATPILLSMNYEQNSTNNRAIQLLNLQRQQLNSQMSDGTKSSSSAINSGSSSLASSPQAPNEQNGIKQNKKKSGESKVASSTASSSSTSGYYAGSNSIESATSAESDSQITTIEGVGSTKSSSSLCNSRQRINQAPIQPPPNAWLAVAEGSRAKIALGSYAPPLASSNNSRTCYDGNQFIRPNLLNIQQDSKRKMRQKFYLDEAPMSNSRRSDEEQHCQSLQANHLLPDSIRKGNDWTSSNQIQPNNPPLKYVSFDV